MHCSAHPRVLGEAGQEAGELGEHSSESLDVVEVVRALEHLVRGLDGVGVLEVYKACR